MNTDNAEQFEAGRDRIFHAITAAINRKSATVGFELHGGQRGRPNVMYSVVVGQSEARRLLDFAIDKDSHTELTLGAKENIQRLAAEVARWPVMSSTMASAPTQRDRS